ncbi:MULTISPECIES: hypothetical protein [unclassified Bradyrhizobium]
MPKRYKPSAYRPAPSWKKLWKQFYAELEKQGVPILQASEFYEAHDREPPEIEAIRYKLSEEERGALERVATALTIAANGAHRTAPGVVAAWLAAVANKPILLRSRDLPPEAIEAIVAHYQRGKEPPGTHLQDVLSRRRIRFRRRKRRPTSRNIVRAAQAASVALPRPRGRPQNVGNWLAAEYLASAYRSLSGRRIVRHQTTMDLGSKVVVVEDGPFYRFLEMVIGPLQKHLKAHGLPPVTIETIERIATEHFQ